MINLDFIPTQTEIAIARQVWAQTKNLKVKAILGQFSNECPDCKSGYDNWRIVPPIKNHGDYHHVTYQCGCGCVFRKIEDARE